MHQQRLSVRGVPSAVADDAGREPGAHRADRRERRALAEVADKEQRVLGSKEHFAKRVAMDLFRYMESFQAATVLNSEQMVVPLNILDRWFTKFVDSSEETRTSSRAPPRGLRRDTS